MVNAISTEKIVDKSSYAENTSLFAQNAHCDIFQRWLILCVYNFAHTNTW